MSSIIKEILTIRGMLTTTFLCLLAGAAYMDMRKRRIPDPFVFGILLTAAAGLFFLDKPDVGERVLGAAAVSVPMLLVSLFVPGAFGGGDIKLMSACGLYLGAEAVFFSFFHALVLGGGYGLYLIIHKNKSRKERIAFGPFLAAGIVWRLIFQALKG